MTATRLLVVRHGESTWNAGGRWQGQADPPLSELGERQAEAAASGIDEPVAAVWTSDLARAHRTAEIIASALTSERDDGARVRVEPRLRERDVGEWSGLTRAEIEARWPRALTERRTPDGWEDDAQLAARALAALRDIAGASKPDDATLVITHGGVIRTLERELGADPEPVPNLGGRWIVVGDDAQLSLGRRRLLIDPDDIEVTVPPPR